MYWLDYHYPIETALLEDTSNIVSFENKNWAYVTTNKSGKWRFKVKIKDIDPRFVHLLIAYEDQRFYSHYGIDPLAMFRAFAQWIVEGRIISGASTITMQLAKLLHPRPRTISSKIIEIFRAFQLEYYFSKKEILEAYLTLAPYGGNIEGIISASMRYFDKKPYSLQAHQMALLVALPQSPESHRPDRQPKRSEKARRKILKYAKAEGIISDYELKQSLDAPLPDRLYPMPRYAGHIAPKLLAKATSLSPRITLHENLQIQLEKWAVSKSLILDTETTLAVLVVRNHDASIQAYLGSHNRFSTTVSGYIDMIRAIRSPASTLKPFIYTEGFEQYVLHPHTIIRDEQTLFGDYMPHNFSNEYTGEVRIDEALQKSLNIPAVKVLQRIGVNKFFNKIEDFVSDDFFIPKDTATLPIALGGIGLSMWQLTELYVALANKGSSASLHYLHSKEKQSIQKKLFSIKSSEMTTDILRQMKAPQGFSNRGQNIAYKTGTSYGYRDAWTVAYSREYTVCVWVGKPNNSIQIKRTGSNTASPLAFEVFSILEALIPQNHWQRSPYNLDMKSPLLLQYFDAKQKKKKKKLAFVYPKDNTRFMSASCSDAIVEVSIKDGIAPYYWYIDNKEKIHKDKKLTLPLKHGAHSIQVLDSKGTVIRRDIWVNKPEC
jgi:penicillin-binding protein 1C